MKEKLAVVLLLAYGLTGCGGGGGGSSIPVTPSTALRTFQAGDTYKWNFNGIEVPQNFPFSGFRTATVSSATFNGAPALEFKTSTTTDWPMGPVDSVDDEIYTQDAEGLHLQVRTFGGLTMHVLSNTYAEPGVIDENTQSSGQTTFDTGFATQTSFQVVGKERVTVVAGTFDCWKVHYTISDNQQDAVTATYWYDPALGYPVKAEISSSFPNELGSTSTDTSTLTLTSTNVKPAIGRWMAGAMGLRR